MVHFGHHGTSRRRNAGDNFEGTVEGGGFFVVAGTGKGVAFGIRRAPFLNGLPKPR